MKQMKQCRQQGFTLVELMIVVAIIALLLMVGIPSYQGSIRNSSRMDAQVVLSALANAMERFYTQNNTFAGASLGSDAADIFPSQSPLDSSTKLYNLSIVASDASSFTIQATPVGSQAGNGPLQLQSTGLRRWDRDNDGFDAGTDDCWDKTC